eukprot:4013252-Prymnesium_polylepis.1
MSSFARPPPGCEVRPPRRRDQQNRHESKRAQPLRSGRPSAKGALTCHLRVFRPYPPSAIGQTWT